MTMNQLPNPVKFKWCTVNKIYEFNLNNACCGETDANKTNLWISNVAHDDDDDGLKWRGNQINSLNVPWNCMNGAPAKRRRRKKLHVRFLLVPPVHNKSAPIEGSDWNYIQPKIIVINEFVSKCILTFSSLDRFRLSTIRAMLRSYSI